MCVLKYDNKGAHVMYLQREKEIWRLLYPEFEQIIKVEMWSGASALVMPHFSTVPTEEREMYRNAIQEVLLSIMEKKKVRKDVRWRNIGK